MSFYLFLCRYSMLSQPQVNIFWTQELSKMIYTCDVNVQKQGHLNWIQGFQFSVAKATLQSQMSVRPSVRSFVIKTPQQLEIIILHHSTFILHHSSFIVHSSFINLHSSFLHFATFKLFSLFVILIVNHFYIQLLLWNNCKYGACEAIHTEVSSSSFSGKCRLLKYELHFIVHLTW